MIDNDKSILEKMGFTFTSYFKNEVFWLEAKSRTGNLAIKNGGNNREELEKTTVSDLMKMVKNTEDALGKEAAINYI